MVNLEIDNVFLVLNSNEMRSYMLKYLFSVKISILFATLMQNNQFHLHNFNNEYIEQYFVHFRIDCCFS